MSLPDSSMDILRALAKSVSELPPNVRQHEHTVALSVIKGLRVAAPTISDTDLAGVTYTIAALVSALAAMPPRELASTLDGSFSAYSLAAASLVSLYDLKGETVAPSPAYVPGGYL
jgi:hypothetical protein